MVARRPSMADVARLNRMFESVCYNKSVKAVQIDIPETLDIDDRAEFLPTVPELCSTCIVTHLFQLAAEVAMEPPIGLGASDLADVVSTVIDAFRPSV